MSNSLETNYDNINLVKESTAWVEEKIDIKDISELIKTSWWTELLKKSFDNDFEWWKKLSDIRESIISSLNLSNLDLSRWSADVYALQIIWHISWPDSKWKIISIDGIVWVQTREIISNLQKEVWINIAQYESSISVKEQSIKTNKWDILIIDKKIDKNNTQKSNLDIQLSSLDAKKLQKDQEISTFKKAHPDLDKKLKSNNTAINTAKEELQKIEKIKNIWKNMQDIFDDGKFNWDDYDKIKEIVDNKKLLKKSFPETYDAIKRVSKVIIDKVLINWYTAVRDSNDYKVFNMLSSNFTDLKMPDFSVFPDKYKRISFAQEDWKITVFGSKSQDDWLLSEPLRQIWFIDNWSFRIQKTLLWFNIDRAWNNNDITNISATSAVVLNDLKEEIWDKTTTLNKTISDLETENTSLISAQKKLKKLLSDKQTIEQEISNLQSKKADIDRDNSTLIQDRNRLVILNQQLTWEIRQMRLDIKAQKKRDQEHTQLMAWSVDSSSTWSDWITNDTVSARSFDSKNMPKKVDYERRGWKEWKYKESYDISYAPKTNSKWYIDAQIDDWWENTHIMAKMPQTIKDFIAKYQEFRDWKELNFSNLFKTWTSLDLWVDWAWDIKIVKLWAISCITIQWGLLKDDFVIPINNDEAKNNLNILNIIQDATWLDLSYNIKDNDKLVEWTLSWNTRTYDDLWIKITKKTTKWTQSSSYVSYNLAWTNADWVKEFNSSDLFEWIPVCDQEIKTINGKNYLYFEFDDSWFNESYNKRMVEFKWSNINQDSLKEIIKLEVKKAQKEAKFINDESNKWKITLDSSKKITWLDEIVVDNFDIELSDKDIWERVVNIELNSWSWNIADFDVTIPYEAWKSMSELIEQNIKDINKQIKKIKKDREEASKEQMSSFM